MADNRSSSAADLWLAQVAIAGFQVGAQASLCSAVRHSPAWLAECIVSRLHGKAIWLRKATCSHYVENDRDAGIIFLALDR
jgi:hypothetical protein